MGSQRLTSFFSPDTIPQGLLGLFFFSVLLKYIIDKIGGYLKCLS